MGMFDYRLASNALLHNSDLQMHNNPGYVEVIYLILLTRITLWKATGIHHQELKEYISHQGIGEVSIQSVHKR